MGGRGRWAHVETATVAPRRMSKPPGFIFIPEGWMRIAQRFNAGIAIDRRKSRRDGRASRLFLPSLRDLFATASFPSVETLGYFHWSLRDRDAGESKSR